MIYMRYMRYKMISKVKFFFFWGAFFNMNIEFWQLAGFQDPGRDPSESHG